MQWRETKASDRNLLAAGSGQAPLEKDIKLGLKGNKARAMQSQGESLSGGGMVPKHSLFVDQLSYF